MRVPVEMPRDEAASLSVSMDMLTMLSRVSVASTLPE